MAKRKGKKRRVAKVASISLAELALVAGGFAWQFPSAANNLAAGNFEQAAKDFVTLLTGPSGMKRVVLATVLPSLGVAGLTAVRGRKRVGIKIGRTRITQ